MALLICIHAKPLAEITFNDWMDKKGLFVKNEDGNYIWIWNVTTVGYARSLEKVKDLLEVNNCKKTPCKNRSIIPGSVDDMFSEYHEMARYCRLEEAEVLMYWNIQTTVYGPLWWKLPKRAGSPWTRMPITGRQGGSSIS